MLSKWPYLSDFQRACAINLNVLFNPTVVELTKDQIQEELPISSDGEEIGDGDGEPIDLETIPEELDKDLLGSDGEDSPYVKGTDPYSA